MMFSFAVNVGVNCNFEQSLCSSWTQDNSDVFDWTRRSGSTGSSGTGPSVDHTTGTGNELVFFFRYCGICTHKNPSHRGSFLTGF